MTATVRATKWWNWHDRLRVIEAIAKQGTLDTMVAPNASRFRVIAMLCTATPEVLEANRELIERGGVRLSAPGQGE